MPGNNSCSEVYLTWYGYGYSGFLSISAHVVYLYSFFYFQPIIVFIFKAGYLYLANNWIMLFSHVIVYAF